jgi:HD-like signal output (HDOD) protein
MSIDNGRDLFERKALDSGVGFPFQARVLEYLVKLVNDPQASVSRLSALIGWNPLLARTVASKANSSCGLPGRVRDVNLALALLGPTTLRDTLRGAVAGSATRHIMYSFHYCEELWHHSLTCGLVAKAIATETGCADPQKAFIAGLVHDVGFLFLGDELPSAEAERQVPWAPASDSVTFRAFVPPALHEEAGAWMVAKWETLPEDVLEAVRYHHKPRFARRNQQLAAIVHVADALCHQTFSGPLGKSLHVLELETAAFALLGIHDASRSLTEAMRDLSDRVKRAAPALELKVRVVKQNLVEVFDQLPERERYLLALHYYEGISFAHIAGILGMNESEVLRLHDGAFARFRHVLDEVGEIYEKSNIQPYSSAG